MVCILFLCCISPVYSYKGENSYQKQSQSTVETDCQYTAGVTSKFERHVLQSLTSEIFYEHVGFVVNKFKIVLTHTDCFNNDCYDTKLMFLYEK